MDQQFENSARWAAAAQNLDFAMQEYLLLQDQHEELCQRLHELSPLSSSSSLSATTKTSPSSLAPTTATSPSISSTRSVRDGPAPSRDQRTTSHTYRARTNQREAVRNESLVGEVAAGERKLFDVNEGMKRALTELLNCEVVRQDRAMRTWVQTRLLETEKELRRERRRRSSATVD